MKKIVFATQNMAPFRMKWLNELSSDFDITVYHLDDYDSSVNKKYISFFPDHVTIKTCYNQIFGRKFFRLKKILDEKPDIIMLDGYGFIGQMVLIFQLKMLGKAFLMSIDGGFIRENESAIKKRIKRFCLSAPTAFFSTSEMTDRYIQHYSRKKQKLYRHLFSSFYQNDIVHQTNAARDERRRRLGLDQTFAVISVGQFIPRKGFDILIKAAEYLDSDVCLIIVGGEPTEEYLAMTSELNNVRFVSFLHEKELAEYYLASDVYVTASREDIWGLTVGEAMAHGLPIVSSDRCIAGLSMVTDGENGYIIRDGKPESYADRIKKLKQEPALREQMVRNNYLLAKEYAIDTAVKQDVKHLNDFIECCH